MQAITFYIEDKSYAIKSSDIVEIIPLVELQNLPQSAPFVSGVFDYRGELVPVIDLSSLISGTVSSKRISTRIILVSIPDSEGSPQLTGVIAEKVTRTIEFRLEELKVLAPMKQAEAFMGGVLNRDGSVIRFLEVTRIPFVTAKDAKDEEIWKNAS